MCAAAWIPGEGMGAWSGPGRARHPGPRIVTALARLCGETVTSGPTQVVPGGHQMQAQRSGGRRDGAGAQGGGTGRAIPPADSRLSGPCGSLGTLAGRGVLWDPAQPGALCRCLLGPLGPVRTGHRPLGCVCYPPSGRAAVSTGEGRGVRGTRRSSGSLSGRRSWAETVLLGFGLLGPRLPGHRLLR